MSDRQMVLQDSSDSRGGGGGGAAAFETVKHYNLDQSKSDSPAGSAFAVFILGAGARFDD